MNRRVNRIKVALGGASNRKNESKTSKILKQLKILKDEVLDYGCGYGFDAMKNNWDRYDPYYYDIEIKKTYQNIVCINVLSAVSSLVRQEIIAKINDILRDTGIAYLCVPRNLPKIGKYSGYQRRPQNYVILTLPSIYLDKDIEIYEFKKNSSYKDKTKNIGE